MYNKFIYTNNKCYFQLDLHNFFQIDVSQSQIDFEYFTRFEVVVNRIEQILSNNRNKTIVLLLDYHGSVGYFCKIGYFNLYKIIMQYPKNKFLILNDSCFSGSMIELIKGYNSIYKSKIENEIKEELDLQVLFSFLKLIHYALSKTKIDEIFNKLGKLIDFYQGINFSDEKMLEKVLCINNLSDKDLELPVDKRVTSFSAELNELGFSKIGDIIDFQNIFGSVYSVQSDCDDKIKYERSKNIFVKSNLDFIEKLSNKNIELFIEALEGLYNSDEVIDFEFNPHPNIEIITSTDHNHRCLSFASIRVNKVTKVYPGSPAMSSFIKEIFLKSDKKPLNFDDIKNEISELDGKYILFPGSISQSTRGEHKKRRWTHLFPKHYKLSENNYSYSFHLNRDVRLRVASLRAISFLTVKALKETADFLNQEAGLYELNSCNDNIADILAVVAILRNYDDVESIITNYIIENHIFDSADQLGIQMLRNIINISFSISNSPIKTAADILSCLQIAIRYEIFQCLISQSTINQQNIFLNDEISKFRKQKNDICNNDEIDSIILSLSNNKALDFINDIERSVFSLLNPNCVFFAFYVTESLNKDINQTNITKSASFIPFIQDDPHYKSFQQNKTNKIESAKCCILSYVKSSLAHLDSICDLQIKNDIMRYVSQQLQYLSSISLTKILLEKFDDEKCNQFLDNIINPIEEVINNIDVSTFFIPCILASIPIKMIIYALYIAISDDKNNSYAETINFLTNIKNSNFDKNSCEQIIDFAKFALMNHVAVINIQKYKEGITEMKKDIKNKIRESVNKVVKLINVSKIRARENIARRIPIDSLLSQINEYSEFLNQINDNIYKNKFHKYLYSSISDILSHYEQIQKDTIIKIPTKGFKINELDANTSLLIKNAANELYTISNLLSISDDSMNDSNAILSNKIYSNESISFPLMVTTARSLNIVEMVPINESLNNYKYQFNEKDGINPNIRELMGLCSANIHILSDRDNDHVRYKLVTPDEFNKKSQNKKCEEEENDLYYSNSYFEDKDDLPYRQIQLESIEEKTYLEQYPNFPLIQKLEHHKDQIFIGKMEMIREDLDLGWNDWTFEAWQAFLYCFNDRMSDIHIHFDPTKDYKNVVCPESIDNAVKIVMKFYPIQRITNFWENKEKIERFVGENRIFLKQIFRAFIIAFDDADRIVTPIHMFTETYEERSPETLKLIFE